MNTGLFLRVHNIPCEGELDRKAEHHAGIFMFQQMAVRHIGMLFRRLVIELHQHFTDAPLNPYGIFPA